MQPLHSEPRDGFAPACSVVICTRDRPADLDRCLEAVARLEYPRFEVLVVDNAPRDRRTREVAVRWGVRHIVEPRLGLNPARNCGARSCDTEVIAYLDDDAAPEPGWLAALAAEFGDPQVMAVTGRIVPPRVETEAESRLARAGGFDLGEKRRAVDLQTPFWFEIANFGGMGTGSNVALRRRAFDEWEGFDERIGYGKPLAGCGEHLAFFSLIERGYRVVYTPHAVVRHPGPQTMEALRARHLQTLAASAGYMTLLFVEHRRYRGAILRYAAEWLGGASRTWREPASGSPPRIASRRRELQACLRGPLLYYRSLREHHPDGSGRSTPAGLISGPCKPEGNLRYSMEAITSEEVLSSLRGDWNRLSETAALPNVFMTFDWFRTWNRQLAPDDLNGRRRMEVLVLRKDGAIAGIAPLIRREASRFGMVVRKVEFLSEGDCNDLVLGDDPAGQTEAVVDFLAQTTGQWDVVDLRYLRETGAVLARIESALRRTGLIYRVLAEERSPYLTIDAPGPEMVARLSRSARRTIRNQQYRLEKMSAEGLRIRIVENPQDQPELLEKMIALQSQKRVRGRLAPPFLARNREAFRSLFDTLGRRGWLYVALMECGERPLAYQLGFRCGKRLWNYITAYDHSFSRLSPGTMLIPAILDYGYSHGYEEYDFLSGEEPYKMRWSAGCHEAFRLLAWKRHWRSQARAFAYLGFQAAVGRLAGRRK